MRLHQSLAFAGLLGLGTLLVMPELPAQACGHEKIQSLAGGFGDQSGTSLPNTLGLGVGLLASSLAATIVYQKWANNHGAGVEGASSELELSIHPEMLETVADEKVLVGSNK